METRTATLTRLFAGQPAFRLRQAEAALFRSDWHAWEDVTVLSKEWRQKLADQITWCSLSQIAVLESVKHDTFKAILKTADDKRIETVLMQNARGFWTICVSSQVGCAMACTFCATGKMGFTRSLIADEIIDQYRYWMYFLAGRHDLEPRISNVVYMGMGEPLANYENVKASLQAFLAHTDMGPTRLTVSTVGLVPMLRKLLTDVTWPPVRLAVSLHSADAKTRTAIMPSSYPKFLDDLAEWTKEYFLKFESRRRHLTFEYVMLAGVNDTSAHADKLIAFARKVGKVKINLIPYNDTKSRYSTSESSALLDFEQRLNQAKLDVTRRRTMGADIAAACGQLIVEKSTQK
ncbi:MAG: 23S rRNA (adenine(2503)-C(2))-methyltransferase RlmN [Candidatus Moraniibacteriota bacterium]|nr:MAG: 23S rRNA (adenine(2503)-C(2))-methyltransferase RlmN [Candidatus Moranbacteria bacterium]